MKFRCSFRAGQKTLGPNLIVQADDAYQAALVAAARNKDGAFTAVEVWDGPARVLTWLQPTSEDRSAPLQ